jgi:elongation factor G
MGDIVTSAIRNVVLVGHAGVGKTSLAEALLYKGGCTQRLGRVDDGSSLLDVDPESVRRRQTLSLSVATLPWTTAQGEKCKINLLDTPGHDDFVQVVDAALSVADLAVFVVSAVEGVQAGDERIWARCRELDLPRLIFVTKEDKPTADFEGVLVDLRRRLGSKLFPLEMPIGEQQDFRGVADVLFEVAHTYDEYGRESSGPVPEDLAEMEHTRHEELVEEVVSGDDDQLERYLSGDEPDPVDVERTLRRAVARAAIFPVLVGSAANAAGVDRLGDLICEIGPSPDMHPTTVLVGGEPTEIAPDPEGEPLVYVFRTVADQFVGQISLLKVLSGTLRGDDRLTNTTTRADERLHGLFGLRGKEHLEVRQVVAGDIAAVAKLTDSPTRTLLARSGLPVTLPDQPVAAGGYTVGVKPMTQSDDDKLTEALRRLCAEDPALVVSQDEESGQTLVTAVGGTHLAVALERLERKFGVRVETEDVRVAYRETIASTVEIEGKVKKQSGGHGQFAVVQLVVSPAPRGTGLEFVDSVVGGSVPRNYIPAVEHGVRDALVNGGPNGHRLTDLRVELVDGKYHSVDSSDMAFKVAAAQGVAQALQRAGSLVLEPISAVTLRVPVTSQGDVLSDLMSRRGRVVDTGTSIDGDGVIEAHVPTAELRGYIIDLRAITGGRGTYRAVHDHYDQVPEHLVATTRAAAAPR